MAHLPQLSGQKIRKYKAAGIGIGFSVYSTCPNKALDVGVCTETRWGRYNYSQTTSTNSPFGVGPKNKYNKCLSQIAA